MKLTVRKLGQNEVVVSGTEARHALRDILKSISHNILIPEMPFTGIVRRQVIDTLKQGRPVWDKPDDHGHPTDESTIVMAPVKIVGVIRADGTWDGEGPDPRLSGEGGEGENSPPNVVPEAGTSTV